MRIISVTVLLFLAFTSYGVEVPSEMEFGGMELKLTEPVRRLLKSDIELITKGQKSYQLKIERANLYFPLIEKIFAEENLPLDFKFLALQESSLVPDAVSSSNAVGYWQFKKESAMEVGLRVDHHVDERMNIIAASRGAARYLKKNNATLNNWIYALLSYNLGLGGVKSKVEDKYVGARRMTIEKDMHWYVIRFLAHKLAYQDVVGKAFNPALVLAKYSACSNKSLREISKETEVEEESLQVYNKWILKSRVPDDKEYYVILPVTPVHKQKLIAQNIITDDGAGATPGTEVRPQEPVAENRESVALRIRLGRKEKKGGEAENTGTGDVALITVVNGIRAIQAKEGDTPEKLAIRGGIHSFDFLRFNEMKNFEPVTPGRIYFLQPKRNKGLVVFHTLQPGETLWDVAQKYGVRSEAIRNKNRMDKGENPAPGRVLWLRAKRPKDVAVEIKPVTAPPAPEKVQPPSQEEEIVSVPKVEFYETDQTGVILTDTAKMSANGENNGTINASVPVNTAGENMVYHEIKAGETLYGISRMYSLSIDTLRVWNNLASNDIKPGSRLIVKKEQESKKISVVEHTVQTGENLYQISRKYGVSIADIQKWNNKQDLKINIGEKIIIRKQQ